MGGDGIHWDRFPPRLLSAIPLLPRVLPALGAGKVSLCVPVGIKSVSARILDGKAIAAEIQGELAQRIGAFILASGVTPRLVAVLVGEDPASEVYVRNKRKTCEKLGMASELIRLPPSASEAELLAVVSELNQRADVHGILVQL